MYGQRGDHDGGRGTMAMQSNRDGEEGEGEGERERVRVRMRRLGVCGEVVAVHHPGSDRFGGRAWVA
jgi:hypothetical protein